MRCKALAVIRNPKKRADAASGGAARRYRRAFDRDHSRRTDRVAAVVNEAGGVALHGRVYNGVSIQREHVAADPPLQVVVLGSRHRRLSSSRSARRSGLDAEPAQAPAGHIACVRVA